MKGWICLTAVSALVFASGAAERTRLHQEAQLISAIGPQPISAATVKFRGAEFAVPTDTNGNVAVYFESPAFDRDSTDVAFTNAVAVGDDGEVELQPALRLGSAPAAIHADEADEALEGQFTPGGEGKATFGALTADRAYVDDRVTAGGDMDVYGPITGVTNLYVGSLTVGPDSVGNALLRRNGKTGLSCIFNENTYDCYLEKFKGDGFIIGNGNVDKSIVAQDDGFAWIAACSDHSDSSMGDDVGCQHLVTITVSHKGSNSIFGNSIVYANKVDCRTNTAGFEEKTPPQKFASPAFCFLVPVRRGDVLTVLCQVNMSASYYIIAYCGIKMVYFGVESAK